MAIAQSRPLTHSLARRDVPWWQWLRFAVGLPILRYETMETGEAIVLHDFDIIVGSGI